MSKGQSIVNLMHELWQMPEYQLYHDLRGLDISIYTFHRNYITVDSLLTFLTSDERADFLFIVKHHDKLVEVGKEIFCALHNYLASQHSLIDPIRIIYNKLYLRAHQFPKYH